MVAAHKNRKTIRPYLLGSLLLHGLITLALLGQLPKGGAEQPKTQSLLLADLASPPAPVKSNRKTAPPIQARSGDTTINTHPDACSSTTGTKHQHTPDAPE